MRFRERNNKSQIFMDAQNARSKVWWGGKTIREQKSTCRYLSMGVPSTTIIERRYRPSTEEECCWMVIEDPIRLKVVSVSRPFLPGGSDKKVPCLFLRDPVPYLLLTSTWRHAPHAILSTSSLTSNRGSGYLLFCLSLRELRTRPPFRMKIYSRIAP